jgi:hypothetical protein
VKGTWNWLAIPSGVPDEKWETTRSTKERRKRMERLNTMQGTHFFHLSHRQWYIRWWSSGSRSSLFWRKGKDTALIRKDFLKGREWDRDERDIRERVKNERRSKTMCIVLK